MLATAAASLLACSTTSAASATPSTAAAPAPAAQRVLPPPAGDVMALYGRLRSQVPAPASDSQPESSSVVDMLVPVVLPQTLEVIDRAVASAPTFMLPALQAARSHTLLAQQRLHDGSSTASPLFLVTVLQAMADGQAAMGQALDLAAGASPGQVALLLPAVQKVREAAARMTREMVALALAAGVQPTRLAAAQAALRNGDALHAAGQYGPAMQQYAGGLGLAANTVTFSMDVFERNLRASFDVASVGWSYAISQGGQVARQGQNGMGRTAADQPPTARSVKDKMHVASVSKTVNGIVMLRLLADMGLSPDTAIGPYLPSSWTRGAGVDAVTFRQLFTHRSGFGQNAPNGNDYAGLKAMVAKPVPQAGSWTYENANYGLMRVLAAVMLGGDNPPAPLDPGAWSAAVYLTHATSRYNTVGVPYSCESAAAKPVVQYQFPDTGNPGYAEPPRSLGCGGFGVQMNPLNLARMLAYLRYTQDLLPTASFKQMKSEYLGFMNPSRYDFAQGKFGVYNTHGGDWDHGSGGLDSCVMMFPINVEAVVLVNSSLLASGGSYPNGGYQCRVLKLAFENAWTAN
jgi:hypothetical protein